MSRCRAWVCGRESGQTRRYCVRTAVYGRHDLIAAQGGHSTRLERRTEGATCSRPPGLATPIACRTPGARHRGPSPAAGEILHGCQLVPPARPNSLSSAARIASRRLQWPEIDPPRCRPLRRPVESAGRGNRAIVSERCSWNLPENLQQFLRGDDPEPEPLRPGEVPAIVGHNELRAARHRELRYEIIGRIRQDGSPQKKDTLVCPVSAEKIEQPVDLLGSDGQLEQ